MVAPARLIHLARTPSLKALGRAQTYARLRTGCSRVRRMFYPPRHEPSASRRQSTLSVSQFSRNQLASARESRPARSNIDGPSYSAC